uniref:Uncharacterized protein n=1 Tax=viral metagenome TaxID=1070528 RepID=A0A6C0JBU7_9ZZZZ
MGGSRLETEIKEDLNKIVRVKDKVRIDLNSHVIFPERLYENLKRASWKNIVNINIDFLKGNVCCTWEHFGPLWEETLPAVDDLISLNKKGYMSIDSSPYYPPEVNLMEEYLCGMMNSYKKAKKLIDKLKQYDYLIITYQFGIKTKPKNTFDAKKASKYLNSTALKNFTKFYKKDEISLMNELYDNKIIVIKEPVQIDIISIANKDVKLIKLVLKTINTL